eukprot:scaffold410_cov125-Isochrysis_galbana.AAC.10
MLVHNHTRNLVLGREHAVAGPQGRHEHLLGDALRAATEAIAVGSRRRGVRREETACVRRLSCKAGQRRHACELYSIRAAIPIGDPRHTRLVQELDAGRLTHNLTRMGQSTQERKQSSRRRHA